MARNAGQDRSPLCASDIAALPCPNPDNHDEVDSPVIDLALQPDEKLDRKVAGRNIVNSGHARKSQGDRPRAASDPARLRGILPADDMPNCQRVNAYRSKDHSQSK